LSPGDDNDEQNADHRRQRQPDGNGGDCDPLRVHLVLISGPVSRQREAVDEGDPINRGGANSVIRRSMHIGT
jgi:hypothetical protein